MIYKGCGYYIYFLFRSKTVISFFVPSLKIGPHVPVPGETYILELFFSNKPTTSLNCNLTKKIKGKIWPTWVWPASFKSILFSWAAIKPSGLWYNKIEYLFFSTLIFFNLFLTWFLSSESSIPINWISELILDSFRNTLIFNFFKILKIFSRSSYLSWFPITK